MSERFSQIEAPGSVPGNTLRVAIDRKATHRHPVSFSAHGDMRFGLCCLTVADARRLARWVLEQTEPEPDEVVHHTAERTGGQRREHVVYDATRRPCLHLSHRAGQAVAVISGYDANGDRAGTPVAINVSALEDIGVWAAQLPTEPPCDWEITPNGRYEVALRHRGWRVAYALTNGEYPRVHQVSGRDLPADELGEWLGKLLTVAREASA